MRIHIVQKGDTLWKIAKKYGVDFEELKAVNTQLSNPDMIMPGMKIKVPTGTVHVKKEAQIGGVQKEAQINLAPMKEEQITEHPYADLTPQPFPVLELDEELPEVEEEVAGVETGPYIPQMPQMPPQMPQMPQMPPQMPQMPPQMPQMPQMQPFEIDINNFNMMNVPQVPIPPSNVLPGMMAPVEDDDDFLEDDDAAMPQMPQMAPQMPFAPPAMFNHCVPISPVMPGPGFNYVPGGFPGQGGFQGQGPFNSMAGGFQRVEGVAKEAVDFVPKMPTAPVQMAPFEIDINNYNLLNMTMPQMPVMEHDEKEEVAGAHLPHMPKMVPMHFPICHCVPVSPVLPGSGIPGGFMGPAPFTPMQAAPQAVSPVGYPGMMGPHSQGMSAQHYNKKDCGCGGPKPHFGGHYQPQGYPVGQQGFPMQPGFPGGGYQQGFPGYQQAPFGVSPYQQGPFNPMFSMPDFEDDDLEDY
ncbi:SafA/ExsA family spore coat assembly protein [Fredinandcohnia humi]